MSSLISHVKDVFEHGSAGEKMIYGFAIAVAVLIIIAILIRIFRMISGKSGASGFPITHGNVSAGTQDLHVLRNMERGRDFLKPGTYIR